MQLLPLAASALRKKTDGVKRFGQNADAANCGLIGFALPRKVCDRSFFFQAISIISLSCWRAPRSCPRQTGCDLAFSVALAISREQLGSAAIKKTRLLSPALEAVHGKKNIVWPGLDRGLCARCAFLAQKAANVAQGGACAATRAPWSHAASKHGL